MSTQWEAALTMPVTEDRDHIQGPATAPVTLVEYGDYECPVLRRRVSDRQAGAGRDGRAASLRLSELPDLDLASARRAGRGGRRGRGAQGQFWPMHDLLYENQQRLEANDLRGYADSLGLDVERFDESSPSTSTPRASTRTS